MNKHFTLHAPKSHKHLRGSGPKGSISNVASPSATRRGATSLKEPLGAYPRKCLFIYLLSHGPRGRKVSQVRHSIRITALQCRQPVVLRDKLESG
jgi:hypothetical protein